MMRNIFYTICLIALASCGDGQPSRKEKSNSPDSVMGWMHGNCLAIKNASIQASQVIQIIELGDPQLRSSGLVTQKTTSSQICPALLDDRKKANLANGYSFYEVKTTKPIDMAIASLQSPIAKDLKFAACTTAEGVVYSVSKNGKPFWKGYYYLGYDSEATCKDVVGK